MEGHNINLHLQASKVTIINDLNMILYSMSDNGKILIFLSNGKVWNKILLLCAGQDKVLNSYTFSLSDLVIQFSSILKK